MLKGALTVIGYLVGAFVLFLFLSNIFMWTFGVGTYAKSKSEDQADDKKFGQITRDGGGRRRQARQQGSVQRDTPHAKNFAKACGSRPFAELRHRRTKSECNAPEGWRERIGGGQWQYHGFDGRYPD